MKSDGVDGESLVSAVKSREVVYEVSACGGDLVSREPTGVSARCSSIGR
jgi:hypothetical protein